jgi:hypothetical protein
MIAEVSRVFGAVHYQEPRTPYLYFYAEHGLSTNAQQSAKPHSTDAYVKAFRYLTGKLSVRHSQAMYRSAVLEQELVRMAVRPEGSVGLNFAAQKRQ